MLSVVNIGATALVTEAATAVFGEAGVSAATGVMTVCHVPSTLFLILAFSLVIYFPYLLRPKAYA